MTARARSLRGRRNNLAGHAAEQIVARHYQSSGHTVAASNWRGTSGEIDLILRRDGGLVFVEVKQAQTHAEAAFKLLPAQIARICLAAAEFLGSEPAGELTPARFDLALVDGQGRAEILENAFGGSGMGLNPQGLRII